MSCVSGVPGVSLLTRGTWGALIACTRSKSGSGTASRRRRRSIINLSLILIFATDSGWKTALPAPAMLILRCRGVGPPAESWDCKTML